MGTAAERNETDVSTDAPSYSTSIVTILPETGMTERSLISLSFIRWPGYLDNSAAGGITTGDSPLESAIREAAEEASLPPSFVRRKLRPTGAISYIYRNKSGWLQPENQYIFDLQMPVPPERADPSPSASSGANDKGAETAGLKTAQANIPEKSDEEGSEIQSDGFPLTNERGEPVVLRPNDGEAETFSLMPASEVMEMIIKGEFKPNCAVVLLDFFIR